MKRHNSEMVSISTTKKKRRKTTLSHLPWSIRPTTNRNEVKNDVLRILMEVDISFYEEQSFGFKVDDSLISLYLYHLKRKEQGKNYQKFGNHFILKVPQISIKSEIADVISTILQRYGGYCVKDTSIIYNDNDRLAPNVSWYRTKPTLEQRQQENKMPTPDIWVEITRSISKDPKKVQDKFQYLHENNLTPNTVFILLVLPKIIRSQAKNIMRNENKKTCETKYTNSPPTKNPYIGFATPTQHTWKYVHVKKHTFIQFELGSTSFTMPLNRICEALE